MSSANAEWLTLLEAERERRRQRVVWDAGAGERARKRLIDELEQMALRLAAAPAQLPLALTDMSPAELLSLHLLAERPAGLPDEDEILTIYERRRRQR
jgi:hypothetical protein